MTPQYGFTAAPAPTYYEPKPEDENTGANTAYANDITNALEFSEKSIRLAFIRKVYTLLSVQLAVTVGLIALFIYHEGIKEFTRNNVWFYVSVYAVFLVTLIMLACPCCCPCGDIRRKAPGNYICLTVFTLASGVLLGVISAQYDVEVVILAIGSTALITIGLTLFAFQTKWDFTRLNGSLFAILLVFMLFGIFMGALRAYFPVVRMVYAGIGVLIFSLYLVHDTQLMMGGKHKYALSPEEYIFATLNIYLDVIMIFMYLLQIFGSRN
jgi:FtsH-binding integral membrane protein